MSAASMFGQSIALGTTVGGGEIYFSDGTVQTTAYNPSNITVDYLTVNETATINTLTVDETATINALTVNETAIINTLDVTETATINTLTVNETATIGSSTNNDTISLTIYGTVQQQLSADNCTQFGSSSLTSNTGSNNTAFGSTCMSTNTTGSYNTGMGANSMQNNSTGSNNTCIGYQAMVSGSTAGQNTIIGCNSGGTISSGSYNTCIGFGSSSSLSTGNTNTTIGYNSSADNYSYSTALGQSATNTASHQIMLGTTSETVVIPATCSIGYNYNQQSVVNILGGVNINNVGSTQVSSNVYIDSYATSIGAATEITLQSETNYLNANQTTITGNCSIGTTNNIGATCNIESNLIVGASTSTTSTFNAIPNFVNGFSCAGGNSFKLYCGTATYVDGSVYSNGSNNTSIIPQIYSGGTGVATYTLDQTFSSPILGCFVNCPNYVFAFWYYYQPSSTNTIVVAFSNLSITDQTLPTSFQYICFA